MRAADPARDTATQSRLFSFPNPPDESETPDMSESRSLVGAYEKIESHEELCAERYRNIHSSITDIKSWLKWGVAVLVSLAISLMGFMAHEITQGYHERLVAAERGGGK